MADRVIHLSDGRIPESAEIPSAARSARLPGKTPWPLDLKLSAIGRMKGQMVAVAS